MEIVKIDLVPSGVMPSCHASQYDIGREIRFLLTDGGEEYTLAGTETISIELRKPDGTSETIAIENTSSNYVDWETSDGELDLSGVYLAEISIKNGDDVLGSANFIVKTEADAYDGADIRTITVGPADICTFETTLPEPLQSVIVDIKATGGNGTPDNPNPINGYTEANVTRCGVNFLKADNLVIASYPYPSMTFDKGTFLKAGTYTASISNVENASSWRFGFRFFNSDGTIITSAITNGHLSITSGTAFLDAYDSNQTCLQASDNTETSVKFTLTKDTYIVGCISNGNVGASTTLDYQIELGSTATAFTPYNGSTVTIAFGQTVYGGTLDVTRGKLHGTFGDSNISDITGWTYGNGFFRTSALASIIKKPTSQSTVTNAICSIYNSVSWNACGDNDFEFAFNSGNGELIIKDSRYTDVPSFLAGVSGIPLVYELATPFDIDLTPEVISALALPDSNNVFAGCGETTVKYLAEG